MMHKIVKYSLKVLLLLPILLLFYFNFSLYYTPSFVKTINQDELAQLDFLADELHNHAAGEKMQGLFPEGFFFIHVLYGLTYSEFVLSSGISIDSELGKKAVKEVNWSIEALNSEAGKSNFLDDLPLENGAFYKGWLTYLVGRRLQMSSERDVVLTQQFKANCNAISQAIAQTDKPYLESYTGATWPADNVLCLAALSLHDRLFEPKYTTVIAQWMGRIKANLEGKTGLIPHSFSLINNKGMEVRGSSQSLMLSFLPEIDANFAQNQYKTYKNWFIQTKLGLPAVREYPIGTDGSGDVDSGPVIWDVGGSASIVGIRAAYENNDVQAAKSLRNSIETFALATNFGGKKKHLFGVLPMADAFVAWVNVKNSPTLEQHSTSIAWLFHLISLLIIVPFSWWIYRL